jgi:CHASE2 domain-containing sensor protein
MNKINIGLYILTGIALIGLIVLSALSLSTDIIVPILTALLGAVIGKNADPIIASFGKKK